MSKKDAEKWHKIWVQEGKPSPDSKKKRKQRRPRKGRRMFGIGLGLTTVQAYCSQWPEDCLEMIEDGMGVQDADACETDQESEDQELYEDSIEYEE